MLAGLVIGTDPTASSQVRRFERVELIVSKGPELFHVPDLVGRTGVDAAAAIGAAGLAVGALDEEYDDTTPAGLVLRQRPEEGAERRRNAPVDLVVSLGPAPIAVPDVTGLTEQEAITALEQAGLEATVNDTPEYSSTVPAGAVLAQSPAGTEVQRRTVIALTLSRGPRMVRVPQRLLADGGTRRRSSGGRRVHRAGGLHLRHRGPRARRRAGPDGRAAGGDHDPHHGHLERIPSGRRRRDAKEAATGRDRLLVPPSTRAQLLDSAPATRNAISSDCMWLRRGSQTDS
ncbi:hypothetical protein MN0502_13290 [Arthrobacter sp. MN05-02]|nr:hypothetical protein MN0502_13290 [Arthrobacter sp. MN05-02]